MPPRRRILGYLGHIGALGLAGCTAGFGGPDTSPPPADTCPASPRVPDPVIDGDEEPPAIPDPPASMTDQALRSYVEAYEYGYAWRANSNSMTGELVEFHLATTGSVVWNGDDGGRILLDFVLPSGSHRTDDGRVHFDGDQYLAQYQVTEAAVWRAAEPRRRFSTSDPPGPREDGVLLECF